MAIDLANLAAFAAVVDEGSFELAARRLHVTPSAVSQRVKALESRMGRILVRRTRPCRPTDAGEVLVRLAGQIALLEDEAVAEVAGEIPGDADDAGRDDGALAGRRPLRMPVAVNADSLATWFLPALATLAERHWVSFDIRQEDQDHSVALLRDGSVMAAVTAEARAVQGCRVEELGAMRYVAVASPAFRRRYFEREERPGAGLAGGFESAPMLVFNRKDALQERFATMVCGRRVDPPRTYLPSSRGFADAARLGLAWGMVPEQMAAQALAAGELVEIVEGRWLDVPLFWQRWRLESQGLAALTAAVRAAAASALYRS
ncbi:LysR family transcriptional regulator ArgP [Phytoactinopolyspora halotolerans]|uniref:HTH-type transcriptional regulator LysG n=1 Tax=Phytoactinopolyspora halotolerans TaxID=1981512 RepID=A0A6L9S4Q3_9ACTN|nr:LysR family transcriptional regulator ArgP [Phytoactinopolyspora halotolerans]NED99982.1 LysR family transcriptional regulator ArgP [Phytoactinopolyspora halotolerans]